MRTLDPAPPTVTPHPIPPDVPMARWGAVLHLAIERLPQPTYAWDDPDTVNVTWDDVDLVWDAAFIGSGFTDAVCDFQALQIDSGAPDELGLFPGGRAVFSLDNRTGEYSTYGADGRLTYFAPGRRVQIWAEIAGTPYWLFAGKVATWLDIPDGTVAVEAFTGVAELAAEPGGDWTPGTAGQQPLARIQAITAAFGYTDPVTGDTGLVPLGAPVTGRSPWEEIQTSALSDGGIVTIDADGDLVYRDRGWRQGRPDQGTVPVFTDNVCTTTGPVVWDLELATADNGLATDVRLFNYATPIPVTVTATLPADTGAWWAGTRFRYTHPEADLWQTAGDGQALADHLLSVASTPMPSIRQFTLHLTDPHQDLWLTAIDRRVGDRIRFLRDFIASDATVGRWDMNLVVAELVHEITPDRWQTTFATSRAVGVNLAELWDTTLFTWDDPSPSAVWGF